MSAWWKPDLTTRHRAYNRRGLTDPSAHGMVTTLPWAGDPTTAAAGPSGAGRGSHRATTSPAMGHASAAPSGHGRAHVPLSGCQEGRTRRPHALTRPIRCLPSR